MSLVPWRSEQTALNLTADVPLCFFSTATQVSPSELQDVFQEASSSIFQINTNGKLRVFVWIKFISLWFTSFDFHFFCSFYRLTHQTKLQTMFCSVTRDSCSWECLFIFKKKISGKTNHSGCLKIRLLFWRNAFFLNHCVLFKLRLCCILTKCILSVRKASIAARTPGCWKLWGSGGSVIIFIYI